MPNALTTRARYVVSGDGRVHESGCVHQGKQARHYEAADGWTKVQVTEHVTREPWGKVCERCMHHAPDGSEQLGLGELLEPAPSVTPERARDLGMAKASAAQPPEWKAAVDREIDRRAASGLPFTADDVSAVTGDSPTGSQGAMGARFLAAVRRGVIRRNAYVTSGRASVRHHPVTQWIGVGS